MLTYHHATREGDGCNDGFLTGWKRGGGGCFYPSKKLTTF